jgi:hypothetical protein
MSKNQTNSDRKYNTTLAGLYQTKNGNMYSLVIDPRNYDALTNIEVGGKLFVRFLTDETKEKFEAKGKKPPAAFLEYIDAKTVAEDEAAYKARSGGGRSNSSDDI